MIRFAWQSDIFLPLFVIVAAFAFGSVRVRDQNPPTSTFRVTLIQPSIPQTLIWDENENTNRFYQLLALSENALKNKTDLLIWPESAVPEFSKPVFYAITNLVRAHHVWLIFNADDAVWRPDAKNKDDYDDFNAAFLFDPNGDCAGIYHKQKLAIFGEYIPLVRWLPFVKYLTPITGSFTSGNQPVTFELSDPNVKAAPLICFEDVFPQLARKCVRDDTDFLVNLTNDGWFSESAEQWQHMANAVFRAVENGVPLVRCANNGLTCWIDSNGRVREIFKDKNGSVYGVGSMTIELPLSQSAGNRTTTFYNRHGDMFGWACVAVAILVLFRSRKVN
jgi:apolipoprotein N-acyltransferase